MYDFRQQTLDWYDFREAAEEAYRENNRRTRSITGLEYRSKIFDIGIKY